MMSEADTRVKLVDPKLHASGWKEEAIRRGSRIAPSRLVDERGNRKRGTEIDYILYVKNTQVSSVRIPLPPLEEQKRIAGHLNRLQGKVETIKRYQEETKGEIEAMTQAVLRKAFSGEL
jgi:hypothetical protein